MAHGHTLRFEAWFKCKIDVGTAHWPLPFATFLVQSGWAKLTEPAHF